MKRLNPETGKPFARGYVREDGMVFDCYKVYLTYEDGTFREVWKTPEKFAPVCASRAKSIKKRQRVGYDFIRSYKLEKGCADCGYNAHPAALDFDHLPGVDKKFELALAQSRGIDSIKAEAAKCEVVCANCHRVRTALRLAQ